MSLLKITDLVKHFRTSSGVVRAVDGVNLTLEPGETLGLVGESGCGKSTLARCIMRLTLPTSGSIHFQGEDIATLRGASLKGYRRKIQMVFQDPYGSLDPRWRIGQSLAEPLRIHGIVPRGQQNAEVTRLLHSVGLPPDAANKYPHEFSGGQRQRVGIARALSVNPVCLIADEPVSALDVSIRAQLINLLRDAQVAHKIGMVFVAHDLSVVRQISNRVAVMYLGKIVEEGAAEDVYRNPMHPYTRLLLSAIPTTERLGKPLIGLREIGEAPSPVNIPRGCRFHTRCPFAQEMCKEQSPTLVSVQQASTHFSACLRSAELPGTTAGAGP